MQFSANLSAVVDTDYARNKPFYLLPFHCRSRGYHFGAVGGFQLMIKHGFASRGKILPEYRIWLQMKERTINPNNPAFHNYGGRGIRVSERWLHSFQNFYEDIGPRPSTAHSIDRIDNNGNYEKSNCRWATKVDQMNNYRCNVILEHEGKTQTLPMWARETGIGVNTLSARYRRGWSVKDILFKGNCNSGALVSNSKLTAVQIAEMRSLYRSGDRVFGSVGLAKRFGVSQCTVWRILKNQSWKHVA